MMASTKELIAKVKRIAECKLCAAGKPALLTCLSALRVTNAAFR